MIRRPFAAVLLSLGALTGCASVDVTLTPADRIAMAPLDGLPLERPLTIRWNAHLVPFIEAETDHDLAVGLGIVHAHLREGQLALAKRAAQGRLAESGGPLATDIDHALRILDIGRAAAEIEAQMPAETRAWMEAYVSGLNAYQRLTEVEPPEYRLLGLEREPWTVQDVISISRIAGADANWFGYFRLLPKRGQPAFDTAWARQRAIGAAGRPSISPDEARGAQAALFQGVLDGIGAKGSNSVVVAPEKSASGAALMANDPHLGFLLPNPWILVGLRGPSLQAVGFTAPGVPAVALGRSPTIAWGGTNMRAASSELTDVSNLDPAEIQSRDERIDVRFWFNATRTVRDTPYGPIFSDAPLLGADAERPFALRWMGFEPTDEFTGFLRAARARTGEEFRAAFADFGVSAQNLLFATAEGEIGMILAARLPRRAGWPEGDVIREPGAGDVDWDNPVDTLELPWVLDPEEGFVVSANNKPAETAAAIGYSFSGDDRVNRLRALLSTPEPIDVDALAALQQDTRSPASEAMAAALLARIRAAGVADQGGVLAAIDGWDGDYQAEAFAPVAFETLLAAIGERIAPVVGLDVETVGDWEQLQAYLLSDLDALPEAERRALFENAVARAAEDAAKYDTWGEMHRLPVRHALGALPVIGDRFVVDNLPVGGSRETPMKTAHGLVRERHDARFGSQARHISDMADVDENYFVLFGGNDGWLGAPGLADQMPLWRSGRYIRMPLRPETVAEEFPFITRLTPAGAPE